MSAFKSWLGLLVCLSVQQAATADTNTGMLGFSETAAARQSALAQTAGRAVLRLANAEILPFRFAALADNLEAVSRALDQALEGLSAAPVQDLGSINQLLYQSERQLTSADGLPGRPWYRHQVYAPGFYTGYGVKTLPRVREAIEAELYDSVDANIAHTADVLAHFAAYLESIKQDIQAL